MDSIVNPKVKTTKGKKVGVHSLIRKISKVEGHARVPRWGLRRLTSKLITYIDLHKPNNKLVSV